MVMKTAEAVVVMCTCTSRSEADAIATALLDQKLAACVSRVRGIESSYWWQGRVEHDEEVLMLIKSQTALFSRIEATIRSLHSADTPEVIALPVVAGSEPYLRWIEEAHGMKRLLSTFCSALRQTFGLILCLAASHMAFAAQDILKPEEAFRYAVSAAGDEIVVNWTIEPEHYLYKERMSFASTTPGVELGPADMPPGKPYADEFFGEMHIYRNAAEIRIPLRQQPESGPVDLEIRSQGCADIGLCYPPQTWTAQVAMTQAAINLAAASQVATGGSRLDRLLGSDDPNEPLAPDLAFNPLVSVVDPFTIEIQWQIADGYYLYRDGFAIETDSASVAPGKLDLPPGIDQWDEHFGNTQVYYDQVTMQLPLTRASPDAAIVALKLAYQGCKKDSICYPPDSVAFDVDLPAATAADQMRTAQPANNGSGTAIVSEQDRLSQLILNGNLFVVLATFAGLGLLLAFTPCVLPMVPILSGIIAGQGENVTTRRAFLLSLTYVLGMAVTYTLAGAAFAALGGQIQAALQKPWIIIGVAGLFVALALSMFGLYELQMPAAIQTRLSKASNQQKGGTFFGTAVMGMLSALVVTTCVAPPLVASMTVIAQAGDITRGALSLFAMSIGMGIPLLVIGTSAGRLLPKAGAWMDNIKGIFGFMMLGLAIWMLDRILPGTVTMLLWATLFIMGGVFLGGIQSLDTGAGPVQKVAKGAGLMATIYGAALLVGALNGQMNPLQPLKFTSNASNETEMEFRLIKSVNDLEAELAAARAAGRTVMLDFYADWCVSCKEMEHYTFVNERVQANLSNTVLLQADVTANDETDQALLKHFDIFGPPTIMFFDTAGNERPNFRVVGFMPADDFADHVGMAVGG